MTGIALISQLLALTLLCAIVSGGANELARGWNENINWVTLEEGEKLSKEKDQPLMLVIHKSWCGACKSLKPQFAESKEIEELSKDFVMVNTLDKEEPSDVKYAPDGGYIPRILFIDPQGTVLEDIFNENGSGSYKYYYPDTSDIASSMHRCLEKTKQMKTASDEL